MENGLRLKVLGAGLVYGLESLGKKINLMLAMSL